MTTIRQFVLRYVFIWIIAALILNIISIIIYPLDVDNCRAIFGITNQIPLGDVTHCTKIINQPIYSYYIPHFLDDWLMSFLLIAFIAFVHGMVKNMIGEGFE